MVLMFKIIFFMRLFFGLNILLFSLFAESKEYNYEFHWLYFPVAKLSINLNESLPVKNEINRSDVRFQLSTQGTLKLYRNYSSEGSIRNNSTTGWHYYLFGQDRGQPEEKLITYFFDKAPEIKKFIDDAGVSSIAVDLNLDKGAVDPFSVLFKTIEQLILEQQCKNEYSVMDGKRRYKVKVELLEKKVNPSEVKIGHDDTVYNCKFTLSKLEKEYRKWPFNKKDRSMNVWFSSNLNFKPIRFQFKTPIGRIAGSYITD